jgi:hypothetical protein
MLEGYHAGDLVDYRIVVTGYVGEYKNAKLELHYKQVNDSGGAIAFVEACNIYIEEINQSLEILGPTEVTQGNNVYIQYNIDWSEITGLGEKFIIRFSGELSTSSSRWKGDNIDVAFGKDKGRETINLKKPGDPEAIPTGSISGYKYNDLNGDGNWDEDEPGLEGWTIQLYAVTENGNGEELKATTTTDEDGSYSFETYFSAPFV